MRAVGASGRDIGIILFAMIAFAGNSLLCRVALKDTGIDPASFTTIRLLSGAAMLWLIVRLRGGGGSGRGSWLSAFALFVYAAGFSFAYVNLAAATGALLLFGAVQVTMIGYGVWAGERLSAVQLAGLVAAFGGLVALLLPGLSAPPLSASVLMLAAGVAWGSYCLRGKGRGDATEVTAGNFLRAVPMAAALSLLLLRRAHLDPAGLCYGAASGALASGVGYAVWYRVVPHLDSTHAATVQLSVPVIAALGGVLLLGEGVTARMALASLAVLGGVALLLLYKGRPAAKQEPSATCPFCGEISVLGGAPSCTCRS